MKNSFLLIVVLFIPISAHSDETYKYCEIWGIASGAGDPFIRNLASRILDKQKLSLNTVCNSVQRDSYNFATTYGRKHITSEDLLRWERYQNFKNNVMDAIIGLVGY